VCDFAYCGAIQLSSDGGVAIFWGVNGVNPLGFQGAEVIFNPSNGQAGLPDSFNIDWGSIDALMTTRMGTQGYDNTLTVHTLADTVDSVTGSLTAALVFGVNGFGTISGSIYATPLGRSSSSQPAQRKTRSSSTWALACLSRRPRL
jgi:hypothetical protein